MRSPSVTLMAKRRLKARVSTTEEPCVSVITVLITGSITAHVMRELTPLWSIFRGQFYPPETPINSSVRYWAEGIIFLVDRFIESWSEFLTEKDKKESSTLLTTCCVQVCSCLKSLWDFCWTEVMLLRPRSKEKIPKRSWRSPGQRKTRFTFHRYIKNPVLNKGEIWAWISPLSCNRSIDPL